MFLEYLYLYFILFLFFCDSQDIVINIFQINAVILNFHFINFLNVVIKWKTGILNCRKKFIITVLLYIWLKKCIDMNWLHLKIKIYFM